MSILLPSLAIAGHIVLPQYRERLFGRKHKLKNETFAPWPKIRILVEVHNRYSV